MELGDRIRSVVYPLIFLGLIAVLWFAAWSEARADEVMGIDPGSGTWYMVGNGDRAAADSSTDGTPAETRSSVGSR